MKLLSQRSRKDKEWKSETVWGFWDTIRQISVIIIGAPEGEGVGYAESLLEEIRAKKKNFSKFEERNGHTKRLQWNETRAQ